VSSQSSLCFFFFIIVVTDTPQYSCRNIKVLNSFMAFEHRPSAHTLKAGRLNIKKARGVFGRRPRASVRSPCALGIARDQVEPSLSILYGEHILYLALGRNAAVWMRGSGAATSLRHLRITLPACRLGKCRALVWNCVQCELFQV